MIEFDIGQGIVGGVGALILIIVLRPILFPRKDGE